jgi:hypothetical protein
VKDIKLIKDAQQLPEEDLNNWLSYLLNCVVTKPNLSAYVREQIFHVVATMVEKTSVKDLGLEMGQIFCYVDAPST